MTPPLRIQGRPIGPGHPTFIIAELSANHRQRFDLAVKTLREMKRCGADAVKLQTYTADTLTLDCANRYFRIRQGTPWDGKTLHELYRQAYTPWEWQPKLKRLAEELGLICFSTPFDASSVDFLARLRVPAYKIASFEITDIPLIAYAAAQGKPMILSTGMAERRDIRDAVQACRRAGNDDIILLKCTSAYPAPADKMNLRMIPRLAADFRCRTGLSDHSLGIAAPIAATALGACVIEKHFILSRSLRGPDAAFSLEPAEFRAMVAAIRQTERAVGVVDYSLDPELARNRIFCRSLFVTADMRKGEAFTLANVRSIRPGYGLAPKHLGRVLGRRAAKAIRRGSPLSWDLIGR